MSKYTVATGFRPDNTFATAILTLLAKNPMNDTSQRAAEAAWEREVNKYNRAQRTKLAADGIRLYFNSGVNTEYQTSTHGRPFNKPLVFAGCWATQLVYLMLIMRQRRIILPLTVVCINLLALAAACGFLSLVGFQAPPQLFEILPCIVLSIGADNMILLVLGQQYGPQQPPELATVAYFRVVLWKVVPVIRCNNLSVLAGSMCAYFSENAHAASLAVYVTVTFTINMLLEETCFMAILLLEERRHQNSRCEQLSSYCQLPALIKPTCFDAFLDDYYIPLVTNKMFQLLFIVISLATIFFSFNLYDFIAVGEDMTKYLKPDADVQAFHKFEHENAVVGPPVYFVVTGGLDFSDKYNQQLITLQEPRPHSIFNNLLKASENSASTFIVLDQLDSWIDDFQRWINTVGCCRLHSTDQTYCQPGMNGKCLNSAYNINIDLET